MRKKLVYNKAQPMIPAFIQKLDRILQIINFSHVPSAQTPAFEHIVSWTGDGQAFVIKSVTQFTDGVLPVYFKHRNYSSFIRQLNMYSFNKIRSDQGDQVYYNEHFCRGNQAEWYLIKRRSIPDHSDYEQSDRNYNHPLMSIKNSQNLPQSSQERNYSRQLMELTRKHKELEALCKKLFDDNQAMIAENAKLWKKMSRWMEKKDKRLENLLMFLIMGSQKQIVSSDPPTNVKHSAGSQSLVFEGAKSDSDRSDDEEADDSSDSQHNMEARNMGNRRSSKIGKSTSLIDNILPLLQKKSNLQNLKNLFKLVNSGKEGNFKKKGKNTFTFVNNNILDPHPIVSNMGLAPSSSHSLQMNQFPMIKTIEPSLCIKQHGELPSQEEAFITETPHSVSAIPAPDSSFISMDLLSVNHANQQEGFQQSNWLDSI